MKGNFIQAWMTVDDADDPKHFIRLMDQARGGNDEAPEQYGNVFRMLDVCEGQNILDVGCGTGGAVRALADQVGGNGKVVGLDNSQTMIDEANNRTSNLGHCVEFHCGDGYRMPFPDNSFDSCFSLRVFEVVDQPLQILNEMYRVTRPGGRIFVNGPDIDMWTFDTNDRETTRNIVSYISDYEVNGWIGRQLARLFAQTGWTNITTVNSTFPVPGFDLMCDLYLSNFTERAVKAGAVSRWAAHSWLGELRTHYDMGLSPCTQTVFRVVGKKPATLRAA
jgi:ubiquinone/menaquinone biosynthesis C-methylase UbiE